MLAREFRAGGKIHQQFHINKHCNVLRFRLLYSCVLLLTRMVWTTCLNKHKLARCNKPVYIVVGIHCSEAIYWTSKWHYDQIDLSIFGHFKKRRLVTEKSQKNRLKHSQGKRFWFFEQLH